MNLPGSISDTGTAAVAGWRALPRLARRRYVRWGMWAALATLAFIQPLFALVVYASGNALISHAPLIPLVAAYLLFIKRDTLPAPGGSSLTGALLFGAITIAAVVARFAWSGALSLNDGLTLTTLAYVSAIAAGGFLFVGAGWMTAAAFPVIFLLFMVPLPDAVVNALEQASMYASADVSAWFFRVSGTPMVRDGTIFALPTIVLEVAEECSGIRSSWVLFITSLVASHMFLDRTWARVVLVAFVIPLGIIRNGIRILVIGLLCVHVGPHMIDSFIHHHGGPIFFALSLIPLFALLSWLRRGNRYA